MLSLRYLARSVPRATSAFAARTAYRRTLTPHTLRFTPASCLSRAAPRLAAAFSMSSARSQDEVLAEKLKNEITYEKDFSESEKSNRAAQRANIDTFLQQQGFELQDAPGSKEVVLTKKSGDETIRVSFNISEVSYGEEDFEDMEDPEMDGNEKQLGESGEDAEADYDVKQSQTHHSMTVTVTKTTAPGALVFDVGIEDSTVYVVNVDYFEDAGLAPPTTLEQEKKNATHYTGPAFNTLEDDLQQHIDTYLKDRGIDDAMANFVTTYSEYKENQEYVKWLEGVKNFVEK